jgi:hypothetical protein
MNNIEQFKNNHNISLLWDVISDEFLLNTSSQEKEIVKNIFNTNIGYFVSKANPRSNIIDLNKRFLSQVSLAINKLLPNNRNVKKIQISNEEVNYPYKIEDIHSARQSDFEKELESRRIELENYMTPNKPKSVNFSDEIVNDNISLDDLIADKIAERNLDVFVPNPSNLNPNPKQPDEPFDIFNKLKKLNNTNTNTNTSNTNINTSNTNRIYEEQVSVALPEIKQEEITYTTNNYNVIPPNVQPIFPMNDMVDMFNQMNKKLDKILEILEKNNT